MSLEIELKSEDNHSKVLIRDGQLCNYQFLETEIMHQQGDPGWSNTEIEMFPIIGATKGNNFSVATPKKEAKLDQHGILRAMNYSLKNTATPNSVSFYKAYTADTLVANPKFPEKSTLASLSWPYNFEFTKTFKLTNTSLRVTFEIHSEEGMPFMIGFHPALKIYTSNPLFEFKDKKIPLTDVLETGSTAFPVQDCDDLTLSNNGKVNVNIKSPGFKHLMLWSPSSNMACIEPITFYPASVSEKNLYKGFEYSSGHEIFETIISPSAS
ncbi:aldose 1-epimerase [Aquimarina sp. 2201CG1-2-11]|uniref:aldose epimerase family protein n=1 Tax=Aquimarina discodermiae TaxID=3231043 RepID=UPI00346349FB